MQSHPSVAPFTIAPCITAHPSPIRLPGRRIGYKGGVLVVTILADEATARFHIAVASGSESYMHRRAIVSGEKCVVVTQPCQRYI
jgi:hypothetical protein